MNATLEAPAPCRSRPQQTVVETMLRGRTHYFSEVIETTPGLAAALLAGHNKVNRRLAQARGDFYGEEMKDGRWRRASGAIGIDTNHQLTNGQHRLIGVTVSGVAVRLPFVFNCEPEARAVEDCGKLRSEADRLTLSGTDADRRIVAVARAFQHMPNEIYRNSIVMPIEELRHIIESFRRPLGFSIEQCSGDGGGLSHAIIMACIARAYIHCGERRMEEFCRVAKSGVAESMDDQAAAYFFKWQRSPHCQSIRSGGQVDRFELYKCTQSAVRAFVDRRELKSIKATHEDLFPVPGIGTQPA